MAADHTAAIRPTDAERVRTVVAAADSLTVVTGARDYDLLGAGLHTVDDDGRLLLHVPADSPLTAEVATAPCGVLSTLLKFTDVAPVALRDRVRARVTFAGWLTPGERETELRLDTAHVSLETARGTVTVGLDELALARPDALAPYEAGMLTHLVDDHEDVVRVLTHLLAPEVLEGAHAVRPAAVDRHGLTLRAERADGHADVRLPFPTPACGPAEVGVRIQALIAAAERAFHGVGTVPLGTAE
ncbi:DUF2470 domain-containing protein [Streptomyces sp. NPDC003327]